MNSTEYTPFESKGDYTLLYIDSNGSEIARMGFNINFPKVPGAGLELDRGYFSLILPDLRDVYKIVIKNGTETLAERIVTSNPPRIQITSPNSSESFKENDLIKVNWSSSDPDKGDKLVYAVALSIDSGKTWFPISFELNDKKFEFVAPQTVNTNSALIKVAVNDGINTVFDTMNSTFTLVSDR